MPYSIEAFRPHVGSVFVFTPEEGKTYALTLDEVEAKPTRDNNPYDYFNLFFSGTKDAFFSQGSYPLRHEALGEQSIFITAVAETENHYHYQAVFSVGKEDA